MLTTEHIEVSSIVFTDLIQLSQHDASVFTELFYNRHDEFNQFEGFLSNIKSTGYNILIEGDAGIGKSSFIYKMALDPGFSKKFSVYPESVSNKGRPA